MDEVAPCMETCEIDGRDLWDSSKASCSGVGLAGTGGASVGRLKNLSGTMLLGCSADHCELSSS
jgi:hypothetical protein